MNGIFTFTEIPESFNIVGQSMKLGIGGLFAIVENAVSSEAPTDA